MELLNNIPVLLALTGVSVIPLSPPIPTNENVLFDGQSFVGYFILAGLALVVIFAILYIVRFLTREAEEEVEREIDKVDYSEYEKKEGHNNDELFH